MSRIAFNQPFAQHQHAQGRGGASQFGEDEDFGQPVDSFESLPSGTILSAAPGSAPISSGDLDADFADEVDAEAFRWKSRRALSPETFARMRLAMAFARR